MSTTNNTVLIIGAGPGGLTLACALQRKGIPCKVFERNTKTFDEYVGGGFALSSGRDWLEQLGFASELEQITTPLRFMRVVDPTGKQLGRYSLELPGVHEALGGHLTVGISRSKLVAMLRDRLAPGTVRLGCELTGIDQNADGTMTAHLCETPTPKKNQDQDQDQDRGRGRHSFVEVGAVVVGADGIKSKVRELMHGPRALGETGQACWLVLKRGLRKGESGSGSGCPVDFSLPEHQGIQFVAAGAGSDVAFGGYPTSPGHFEFFSAYKLDADPFSNGNSKKKQRGWREGAYSGSAARDAALARMAAMPGALGWVARHAEAREVMHVSVMDAGASASAAWHVGRVGVLGDAAHAPIPTAGQGCNAAIGDACALAKHLAVALGGATVVGGGLKTHAGVHAGASSAATVPASSSSSSSYAVGTSTSTDADTTRTDAAIAVAFERYEAERRAFGEGVVAQGRGLMSKWANMAVPQTADTPTSSFEAGVQRVVIGLMERLFRWCPKMVAAGMVKEYRAGCGTADVAKNGKKEEAGSDYSSQRP